MYHVVDRVPDDGGARLDAQGDSLVLFDLGDGCPHHVDKGDRLTPPPRRLMACEHEQVLRVAAHAGGEVVHPEQVPQPLGILFTLLQLVDEPNLAFDK